jgi:hypothetical protein
MITAAAPSFRMSGHPLPACWASAAFRLRQATLTCSYADKVTIYNCRNLPGAVLNNANQGADLLKHR